MKNCIRTLFLAILLIFSNAAYASNEIVVTGQPGKTAFVVVYCKATSNRGKFVNVVANTLDNLSGGIGTIGNYAISLSEQGGAGASGIYYGSLPASTPVGYYVPVAYLQAGGAAALSDMQAGPWVTGETINWTGSDLVAVPTGDPYARLGVPAGASVSADIATINTNVGTANTSLTTLTTRVPSTILFDGSGYIKGAVWAYNTGLSPASQVLKTSSNPIAADSSGLVTFNNSSIASVTGSVNSVTSGVTVSTNNDKSGYALTQAFPANFSSLAITGGGAVTFGNTTIGSVTGSVGSVSGNVSGSVASVINQVTANVTSIAGQTASAASPVTFPASIGTSTYAGADTSGTTTLLTRIPNVLPTFPTRFASLAIDSNGYTTFNNASIGSVGNITGTVPNVTVGSYATGYSPDVLVWGAASRTVTALPSSAPAWWSSVPGWYTAPPTDYQQRGVAVTLPSTVVPSGDVATIAAALLGSSVDGSLTLKQIQAINLATSLETNRTWNAGTHTSVVTFYRRLSGGTGADTSRPIKVLTTVYDATNTQVVSQTVTLSNLP